MTLTKETEDETEKTFITIKPLEQRIHDLDSMMSVCVGFIQK